MLDSIIFRLKIPFIKIKYRRANKHNGTKLKKFTRSFTLNKVNVGRYSYGHINIMTYGNNNEQLKIGSFCSIANEVYFITGGNHAYQCFTSFPFRSMIMKNHCDDLTNGPIIVEDDVWIGHGVTILSGVKIGKGSIVASCAVVTSDVEPYTIVGGIPAKKIKDRFPESVKKLLNQIDYNNLKMEQIEKYRKILFQDISEENLEEFKKIFKNIGVI